MTAQQPKTCFPLRRISCYHRTVVDTIMTHYFITVVWRKLLEIWKSNLSVKPTVAASAGTKLPMWERKTIKATWKNNFSIWFNSWVYSRDTTSTFIAHMWPRMSQVSVRRSPQNQSKFNRVVNTQNGFSYINVRCFRQKNKDTSNEMLLLHRWH